MLEDGKIRIPDWNKWNLNPTVHETFLLFLGQSNTAYPADIAFCIGAALLTSKDVSHVELEAGMWYRSLGGMTRSFWESVIDKAVNVISQDFHDPDNNIAAKANCRLQIWLPEQFARLLNISDLTSTIQRLFDEGQGLDEAGEEALQAMINDPNYSGLQHDPLLQELVESCVNLPSWLAHSHFTGLE